MSGDGAVSQAPQRGGAERPKVSSSSACPAIEVEFNNKLRLAPRASREDPTVFIR